MKTILALLFMLSTSVYAAPMNFHCTGTYNSEEIFSSDVSIEDGERNKMFASYQAFRFFLTRNQDKVELQAFNGDVPSRSYATATIKDAGSSVELSLWTRDYLMEVHCSL